jgi:hypothetical protein
VSGVEYTEKDIKSYHKFIEEQMKKRHKENEIEYYEYIKNNKDIFEREYYVEQLKKKGFTF